uniref:DUF4806 domain-containing protein n=1 Tax=Anopheles albimanus TaxID=7167 RepID=A0A182FWV6_ANOAL
MQNSDNTLTALKAILYQGEELQERIEGNHKIVLNELRMLNVNAVADDKVSFKMPIDSFLTLEQFEELCGTAAIEKLIQEATKGFGKGRYFKKGRTLALRMVDKIFDRGFLTTCSWAQLRIQVQFESFDVL